MDELRQDVRYSLRALAESPLFTLVAVGTLALGTAAAVGIFTVVNAVLLRPLPLGEPQRLAVIGAEDVKSHARVGAWWTKFELLRANHASFSGVAAYVGRQFTATGRDHVIAVRHVSANYFKTMKIPVLRGRVFTERDAAGSEPVTVINDSAANKYFPGADPIGRRVASSGDNAMRRIVGVVGDVRYDGPTRSGQEELYLPYRQVPWPSMSIVVSSDQSADAVAGALRGDVSRLDRDQAMTEIRAMDSVVAATTTQRQFTTSLLGAFAILATTLAAIGLYGVVALFVSQRRHEFGVRMALGATRGDVLLFAMREGLSAIGLGAIAGVLVAALASRVPACFLA
jgi:hypothetical protein